MAFASSSPFDKQPRSFKIVKHFTPPCSDTGVLIKAINDDIHALFQADVRYYKIGVGLISLVSARQQQLDLFNQRNNDPAVMNVLDNINKKLLIGKFSHEVELLNLPIISKLQSDIIKHELALLERQYFREVTDN